MPSILSTMSAETTPSFDADRVLTVDEFIELIKAEKGPTDLKIESICGNDPDDIYYTPPGQEMAVGFPKVKNDHLPHDAFAYLVATNSGDEYKPQKSTNLEAFITKNEAEIDTFLTKLPQSEIMKQRAPQSSLSKAAAKAAAAKAAAKAPTKITKPRPKPQVKKQGNVPTHADFIRYQECAFTTEDEEWAQWRSEQDSEDDTLAELAEAFERADREMEALTTGEVEIV